MSRACAHSASEGPVKSAQEGLEHAAHCAEMATASNDVIDQRVLLNAGVQWRKLAEETVAHERMWLMLLLGHHSLAPTFEARRCLRAGNDSSARSRSIPVENHAQCCAVERASRRRCPSPDIKEAQHVQGFDRGTRHNFSSGNRSAAVPTSPVGYYLKMLSRRRASAEPAAAFIPPLPGRGGDRGAGSPSRGRAT